MSKKRSGVFLLLIAVLIAASYYSQTVQAPIQSTLNHFKTFYLGTLQSISETVEEHFHQRQLIIAQRKELEQYKKNHLISHQIATELSDLLHELNTSIKINPDVELVRTVSYAKMGDTNKLWLQMNDFNRSRVYGLIYREQSAGIVIEKNGQPLALLNSDPKCSYAVFVGKQMAPGIIHGQNSNIMTVKFIPTWIKINPGDEVITSGLDTLFFKGIKVGKVLDVSKSQGYQQATVEPYRSGKNPSYFHLVTKVR